MSSVGNQQTGVKGIPTFGPQPTRVYGNNRVWGNISAINPQTQGLPDLNFRQVRPGAYRNIYMRNSYQQILRPLQ